MTRTARSVTRVLGVAGAAFALSLAAPALAYAEDPENGAPTCESMTDTWSGTDRTWGEFNCADPDQDDVTATKATIKSGPGTVKVAGGAVTYTGDATGTGPAVVTVTVTDGHDHLVNLDITVTYDLPAPQPNAVDDEFTVKANEVLAGDVSANDSNVGDGVFEVTAPPAHGKVVMQESGTFTYTPDKDFEGTDSFSYKVTVHGKATENAKVKITVKPKGGGGGPSTSPSSSPSTSKTPGKKGLAKTGSPLLTVALTGAGVLVAGGVVLFVARRRREV